MNNNLVLEINYNHLYFYIRNRIIASTREKNMKRFVISKQNSIYLDRMAFPTTTKSIINNQEQKPVSFPHYTHHRHGSSSSSSSSIDKNDHNDIHRLFPHAVKAQRHSDPYSIKWITEGPLRDTDPGELKRYVEFLLVYFIAF